jgi:hypothetical protein
MKIAFAESEPCVDAAGASKWRAGGISSLLCHPSRITAKLAILK